MHCISDIVMLSLFLSLVSLQCCCELIVVVVLPQRDHTCAEVSASWKRGEEILLGAKQAIEEANNVSLPFKLTLVATDSGPITRYDLTYPAGDVLEIIANFTWQKRASDIIDIAGVLHSNILAILNRFQLPIVSIAHLDKIPRSVRVHY